MPEGDVVRATAQRLDAALSGRTLERAELRWPSTGGSTSPDARSPRCARTASTS
ncbi:hypothetical protein NKG05_00690 [Oerskovia sp. M15]